MSARSQILYVKGVELCVVQICMCMYVCPSDLIDVMNCVLSYLPCSVGSRLTHIHLLSGGILPLLSLLESTLARHAHTMTLSKEVCSLKVVRMRLDDGRRLIGVCYPLPLISEIATLLSSFKHGKQVNKTPDPYTW